MIHVQNGLIRIHSPRRTSKGGREAGEGPASNGDVSDELPQKRPWSDPAHESWSVHGI